MTIKTLLTAALAATLLSACGGGGGGGTPPPPPPGPTPANTSNPAYLPLAAGNVWTFQSNGKITDAGPITLLCSCAINNKQVERLNLTDATGAFIGAFYYAKGAWPNAPYANHRITYLVGVRTATSSTVSLSYVSNDGSIPGYPTMDDAPVTGETLTLNTFSPPDSTVTTFSGVGASQAYGTNQVILNIATATIASGGTSIVFQFAPGVGFTSFPTTNLLTNFQINAVSSQSLRSATTERVGSDTSGTQAASAMRSILDRF